MCIRDSLLSLAGVYQPAKEIEKSKVPAALTRFLKEHPEVDRVEMCIRDRNIYYGNRVSVVVRGRESRPHGEGRQSFFNTNNKERCLCSAISFISSFKVSLSIFSVFFTRTKRS